MSRRELDISRPGMRNLSCCKFARDVVRWLQTETKGADRLECRELGGSRIGHTELGSSRLQHKEIDCFGNRLE